MTKAQTLALRCSEIRSRLNEVAGLEADAFTDEIRQESDTLTTEYRDVETKYRAALVSEGDDAHLAGSQFGAAGSSEDRAYTQLVSKASVGNIFAAAAAKWPTEGAEAELQKHHNLNSNQVPIDLLRGSAVEEHRAATAAPTNTGASQQPVIMPVFADGDVAFLGVDTPVIPTGDAVFPILTTRAEIRGPFTGDDVAAETDGNFDAELLTPGRSQASFRYSRTDAARFAGLGESLRTSLSEGLTEALSKQVVSGTEGLLTGTNLPNNNASSDVTTFAELVSNFGVSRVDGRFASRRSDLKVLLGSEGSAYAGGVYRANNNETSALDRLMEVVSDVKVSAHIPAVLTTKRQNGIVRLGMRRDMVAPIWEGVTILVSDSDKALVEKGQILITAILVHAVKITRAAGFYKSQIRLTA